MIERILKIRNLGDIQVQDKEHRHKKNKRRKIEKETVKATDTLDVKNNELKHAIKYILDSANHFNSKIYVEVEKDLGIKVVKVIDKNTGKVVRKMPTEDIVELSRRSKDLKGLLISEEG